MDLCIFDYAKEKKSSLLVYKSAHKIIINRFYK